MGILFAYISVHHIYAVYNEAIWVLEHLELELQIVTRHCERTDNHT